MTLEELQEKCLKLEEEKKELERELETTKEETSKKNAEYLKSEEERKAEIESLKLHNQKLFLKLTDVSGVFEDKEKEKEKENEPAEINLEELAGAFA